jgi:hypothetical protein
MKFEKKRVTGSFLASLRTGLYRTAEGRVGCQLDLTVTTGDRKRLDQAYEAIMDAVGERRGRPRGIKKVQTKLMLPEPA